MSGWMLTSDNRIHLNPDHVIKVGIDEDGHYAVTTDGVERITDPDYVIRQLIPSPEAYVCIDAYKHDNQWRFVETPVIAFALTITGAIRPVVVADLDVVSGDDWAIRKADGKRVWLPMEACYEDVDHWREVLETRDAVTGEPTEDDKQEALL